MRFNDLLRTVLAHDGEGMASAITRWRQCIDLVAQYDVSGASSAYRLNEEESAVIFNVLTELQPRLGLDQRVQSIVELGSRLRSVRLCRFLAQDHPAIVSAVMTRARLADEDWAVIIPALGPLARSILRRRPDLGPAAMTVLDRFGSTDLALPPGRITTRGFHAANDEVPAAPRAAVTPHGEARPQETVPTMPVEAVSPQQQPQPVQRRSLPERQKPVEGPSEIRQIVERIERFTRERIQAVEREVAAQLEDAIEPLDLAFDQVVDRQPAAVVTAPVAAEVLPAQESAIAAVTSFTFLTDEKGRMTDAEGISRAAVAGLTTGFLMRLPRVQAPR